MKKLRLLQSTPKNMAGGIGSWEGVDCNSLSFFISIFSLDYCWGYCKWAIDESSVCIYSSMGNQWEGIHFANSADFTINCVTWYCCMHQRMAHSYSISNLLVFNCRWDVVCH